MIYIRTDVCSPKVGPFDGAQAPPFRTGKMASLKVNPEQTRVFRPGGRRVDNKAPQGYKLIETY
jgi:hypothetical protein